MKENFDSLFDPAIIRDTIAFYETRDRWQEILNYRKLTAETGHVDNLFYGDSITDIWPLHEFFPNHSLLNRGIGGDNIHGLYYRLHDDVYPYTPKRVFILIGINGIEQEKQLIIDRTRAVAQLIKERRCATRMRGTVSNTSPRSSRSTPNRPNGAGPTSTAISTTTRC